MKNLVLQRFVEIFYHFLFLHWHYIVPILLMNLPSFVKELKNPEFGLIVIDHLLRKIVYSNLIWLVFMFHQILLLKEKVLLMFPLYLLVYVGIVVELVIFLRNVVLLSLFFVMVVVLKTLQNQIVALAIQKTRFRLVL